MSKPAGESEQEQGAAQEQQPDSAEKPVAEPEEQVEAVPASTLEQLNSALNKADEHWETVLRTKAEMENLRKRTQRDIENAHKYALEKMSTELLGVRDSMELGLNAIEEGAEIQSLREGAELTLKLMTQVMEKFHIKELNPVGEKFDPAQHQAVATQESDKLEPNSVVSVMQKGYLLQDRLLRPAMVTVAKSPEKSDQKT